MQSTISKRPRITQVYDRKGAIKKGKTDALVSVCIYFDKKRIYISTDLRIQPSEWDEKKGEVSTKAANYQNKNRFFYEMREKVECIYDDFLKKRKTLTLSQIKDLLTIKDTHSFTEFMETELHRKVGAIGTLKGLMTTIKTFKAYKKEVSFDDVNIRFLKLYESHLITKNLSANTRNKHFRHLRMFWNIALEYEFTNDYPFKHFKLKDEDTERAHLTIDELKQLVNTDISSLTAHSNTAQSTLDMYLFGCVTGLRISDILLLEPKQVKMVKGLMTIETKQQKTGDKVTTFFESLCNMNLPQLKDIFTAYIKDAKTKRKTIFPATTPQNANRIMKKIAELAQIDKNLTFHTSRHTCAMLLLNENRKDITLVAKILGHKNTKTTSVYAKMRDDTVSDELANTKSLW